MDSAIEMAPSVTAVGVLGLCAVLGLSRATFYRRKTPRSEPQTRRPPRKLSSQERAEVLAVLHQERFVDQAPAEIYATLLDEGVYLASERTMYRILAEHQELRERRNQLRHPPQATPRLVAKGPNQVWTWDITKLLGPAKWTYYHLYVVIDIFSRYVVGWLLADRESAALAKRLLGETCARQEISPGNLTIHADKGTSMTSKAVAQLYADLGVTQSHSRPRVSDDNPFSEAQFKTLKYRPNFPTRFDSLDQARAHCRDFFAWYNDEHRHGGIGLHTPAQVHLGQASGSRARRGHVLAAAYEAHPERFVRGVPMPPKLPEEVWINRPPQTTVAVSSDEQVCLALARKVPLPGVIAQSQETAALSRVAAEGAEGAGDGGGEAQALALDSVGGTWHPDTSTFSGFGGLTRV